jgi:rhomboid protease GluP
MLKRSPLTTALLVIITLMWLFEAYTHAPDSDARLADLGAIIPGLLERHEYWRLLAAMFLHAGWLHWAANSWALFQLGSLFEILFGTRRFAVVYFVSGICASAASSLYQHEAVGASGAIFGVLGALIFSIRRSPRYRHIPEMRSLINQLVFWMVLNIVIGFSVKYIDNVAHITGLVTGLILGFLPHREPPPPPGSSVIDVQPRDHHYGSE